MKRKIFSIILILSTVLALVRCGNSKENSTKTEGIKDTVAEDYTGDKAFCVIPCIHNEKSNY